MEIKSTSEIIESIKSAIKSNAPEQLGELFSLLVQAEPTRWITLLYLNRVLPQPWSVDFRSRLRIILLALTTSLKIKTFEPQNYLDLVDPLFTFNQCFCLITNDLDSMSIWTEAGSRIIFRFATFMEDQFTKSQEIIDQDIAKRGYYGVDLLLSDDFPSIFSGPNTNHLAAFEDNGENLQLILAYTLSRYKDNKQPFYSNLADCPSPYNDRDFAHLIALATIWRRYQYLWDDVVFLGWHAIQVEENKDLKLYVPRDFEEFMRFEVGSIRMQQIQTEVAQHLQSMVDIRTNDASKRVSESINIPIKGGIWDGQIDMAALRECIEMQLGLLHAEYEVFHSHYDTFIEEVRFGSGADAVVWTSYRNAVAVLRVLGFCFEEALKKITSEGHRSDELRKAILIKKNDLVQIVAETTNLSPGDCITTIDALTYKPEFRELELWDTPLIVMDENLILFTPCVVRMGNPGRAIENVISQWNETLFTRRGKALEKSLLEFLKSEGIKSQGPVVFITEEGVGIECDLVCHWDGYLILIEVKCTKSIYSAKEMFRARKHIEDSIEQLNIRSNAIVGNWERFVLAADELGLPKTALTRDKIKMISVTNVLQFTGLMLRNVVVTDEFCFQRYFGTPDIESFMVTGGNEKKLNSVQSIRSSERISAEEFFSYLENPPQVKLMRDCLSTEPLWLPKFQEMDKTIGMLRSVYKPNKELLKIISPEPQRKGKQRHRHHRKKMDSPSI